MREEKNIPFRNYCILGIVLILSIIVVIYFYMWYGEIENNRTTNPIMDEYLSVINYNELDNYLIENENAVIYFSVLGDNETRRFENKFKNLIDDYSWNNTLLYMNLTEIHDSNKTLFKAIKHNYNITSLPCIIVFKNGYVNDTYSISDNKYDLNLLVSYFKIRGIIND